MYWWLQGRSRSMLTQLVSCVTAAPEGQRFIPSPMPQVSFAPMHLISVSSAHHVQWIGLREHLQESPIEKMGKSMVSGVDFPQQTNPLTCGANPIPQPFRAPSRKHGFVGMKKKNILGWVQSHGGNPNSSKSWSSDDHDLVLKPMVTTGDPPWLKRSPIWVPKKDKLLNQCFLGILGPDLKEKHKPQWSIN